MSHDNDTNFNYEDILKLISEYADKEFFEMFNESKTDSQNLLKGILTILFSGKNIHCWKNLTSEQMEKIYQTGYCFYSSGNYLQAEKIFHYLCIYQHTFVRNWLALGAALQMQDLLDKAIIAYSTGQIMDITNPEPALRAFGCYFKLGQFQEAISALNTVICQSRNKPQYSHLFKEATMLLKELENSVKKSGA